MGIPVVFIRTNGCPVKCSFCDTADSWSKNVPKWVKEETPDQVVAEAIKCWHEPQTQGLGLYRMSPWAVITGGEPAIQKDLEKVVDRLHDFGFKVAIETSGYADVTRRLDWVAVSPKPKLHYKMCIPIDQINELKYVVTEDFDESVITEEIRNEMKGKIWLQPDGNNIPEMVKKCYDIAMRDPRLRCGIQMHKIYEVK